MIPYALSHLSRILRESLPLTMAPPRPSSEPGEKDSRRVTVDATRYVVPLNGTVHHVRRDRVCDCGGSPLCPCAAIPLVQAYLAGGGPRPPGRDESTWPQAWATVPAVCPICDCPTLPDHHLNSRAGPGWRCSLSGCEHFWQVRMNPLRRYLAAHPPQPCYPWNGASLPEQQAWLEAHTHPPHVVASQSNGGDNALDRTKKSKGRPRPGAPDPGLEAVWIPRGPERPDDRLLFACFVGRRR
jgi:hypothetical protein